MTPKDFEVMYDSSLNTRIRLTLPPFHHSGNTPSSPNTLDPDLKELTWLDDCNTEVSDESTPQPGTSRSNTYRIELSHNYS